MNRELISYRSRSIAGDVYRRAHDDTYSIGGDAVNELFWEAVREAMEFVYDSGEQVFVTATLTAGREHDMPDAEAYNGFRRFIAVEPAQKTTARTRVIGLEGQVVKAPDDYLVTDGGKTVGVMQAINEATSVASFRSDVHFPEMYDVWRSFHSRSRSDLSI